MTEQDEREEDERELAQRREPVREIRRYVCNAWKGLRIGAKVQFENGYYQTDDPDLQAQIERNDHFGGAIGFQDDPALVRGKAEKEAHAKKKAELEAHHRAVAAAKDKTDQAAKQKAEDEQIKKSLEAAKKKTDDDARVKAAADIKAEAEADAKKEAMSKGPKAGSQQTGGPK